MKYRLRNIRFDVLFNLPTVLEQLKKGPCYSPHHYEYRRDIEMTQQDRLSELILGSNTTARPVILKNIVILGAIKQQADALSTQFRSVHVLFKDEVDISDKAELVSSDAVVYEKYEAMNIKQEFFILRRRLTALSPDVVYVNGYRHLWMAGILIHEPGSFRTKPIILATFHNSWVWQKAYQRIMIAISCQMFADGVFTLATFQMKRLRRLGITSRKMRTIPNAIDTQQFSPVGTSDFFAGIFPEAVNFPIIVNIATIDKSKGQDILIKSISLVKNKAQDVRLVLIGKYPVDSPYVRYLRELIKENDLESNVFIQGGLDHNQISNVLRSSDLSAISSWNEVCPFILLESLAAGRATVSTAVGGIPDIIKNGVNGFLVPPGDIKAFADCIIKIAGDPLLRASIEKQARISVVEKYSFEVIGKEHKDFLTSVLRQ